MEGDMYRVVIETDDPRRVLRLIHLLRRAADLSTEQADRAFWRDRANTLVEQAQGLVLDSRNSILRPKDDDEIALRRVIEGEQPYPVLSRMDARRVVIHFGHTLSARQLGERLHMDHRTVARWRTEYKEGKWRKYGL